MGGDDGIVANCFCTWREYEESEANANLIVEAVNACASVNPDNPMAVAQSITDLYEALKTLVLVCRDVSYTPSELIKARQALAKANNK